MSNICFLRSVSLVTAWELGAIRSLQHGQEQKTKGKMKEIFRVFSSSPVFSRGRVRRGLRGDDPLLGAGPPGLGDPGPVPELQPRAG